MLREKKLTFRVTSILAFVIFYLSGCNENGLRQESVTCKTYAEEINTTFLDADVMVLEKGKFYIVQQGSSFVAPTVDGNAIRLEIVLIDINKDSVSECVSIKQDENDIYEAHIVFY